MIILLFGYIMNVFEYFGIPTYLIEFILIVLYDEKLNKDTSMRL